MNSRSPFADNRFEYEVRHLYFIEDDLYEKLQFTKPCFLIGSRGTGKTTLLRSLSWRERLSNANLREQLSNRLFRDFIGIYIKLPDVQIEYLLHWLKGASESVRGVIYSRYLELIQLQELLEAVANLQAVGEIDFTAKEESLAVSNLLDECDSDLYLASISPKRPISLLDLSRSVRSIRRMIEKAYQRELPPLDVLDQLGGPSKLCELSRRVASGLTALISSKSAQKLYFKICFDEAETLDSYGVKIIATWVRLSQFPLYHAISFVSHPDSLSETLLPGLTVQSADATLIDLDGIKDKEFLTFSEGVTNLRIREFLRRFPPPEDEEFAFTSFKIEELFGKLNINFLIESVLKNSVSPLAKNLLLRAGQDDAREAATSLPTGDDDSLPLYETYLNLQAGRRLPDDSEPKWSKRKASSQELRKSMVAAYLSLMHDLKVEPRYAYADMILQLSDSCIRDFLNNIEYIFRDSKLSLTSFVSKKDLRPTFQDAGLRAASKAKYESLPSSGINHPSKAAKLVSGLGILTSMLQRQSRDGKRHLLSNERGIYCLDCSSRTISCAEATQLIVEAAEAGFLKVVSRSDHLLKFRVHTSLAPEYGFSYRGAYYNVPLLDADVNALVAAEDEARIRRTARFLFSRIDGSETVDMFDDGGHDG